MEGRYNKLSAMIRNELPDALFAPFTTRLLETARLDIAQSLEVAYPRLDMEHARSLLGFGSVDEAKQWATQRGWKIDGSLLVFTKEASASAPRLNALNLIAQSLSYANELERII